MKRHVIVIHGGSAYDSYKEYIADLKRFKLDKEDALGIQSMKGWKDNLQKDLGAGYQVFNPEMPNWSNAKYAEWKIWFEKLLPYFRGEVIIVGHSLGGIFLARYLAENALPKKTSLKAAFLIAAPWNARGSAKSLADFVLPKDMSGLIEHGSKIYIYQSMDDGIVSPSNAKKYEEVLPQATVRIFKNRGHFITPKFPELIKDIKALYR